MMDDNAQRVMFISEWEQLPGTEHPSRTCPSICPWRHGLVETAYPSYDKDFAHVPVPFSNHLTNLKEIITITDGV